MFDALEQRNFPPRTIEAYVAAVVALSRHYRVSPDTLSPAQVQAWLQLQRRAVADLPFQILVRALAFFFVEVLAWPIIRRGKGVEAAPPAPKTSALRQRMTDDLKLRNFSPRTISAYVGAISRFACHFRKCPTQLGASEIRAWQLLLHSRGLSFSTYNVSSCALRFLYCVVLGKPDMTAVIPFARAERKLPVILSQGEVCTLLRATGSDRDRLVVTVAYACGLRVFKLASLRSVDVDNARRLLHVHAGKGRKDRLVPLSDSLLHGVAEYLRIHRPGEWLFPGESAGTSVDPRTIQRIVATAAKAAGIAKHITPHMLRHCFATHHLKGQDRPAHRAVAARPRQHRHHDSRSPSFTRAGDCDDEPRRHPRAARPLSR